MTARKPLMLTFHDGEDVFAQLDRGVPTGLYIVQCSHQETCFRAGAGGVHGETSTLVKRLKQHRGKPPNRNDINWTEYHRGWNVIWAVQFPGCDRLAGRLCEALLIGKLAEEYHFIPEATGSGFHASTDTTREIVAFARALEPTFLPILERQANKPLLRKWAKGSEDGTPSGYLD